MTLGDGSSSTDAAWVLAMSTASPPLLGILGQYWRTGAPHPHIHSGTCSQRGGRTRRSARPHFTRSQRRSEGGSTSASCSACHVILLPLGPSVPKQTFLQGHSRPKHVPRALRSPVSVTAPDLPPGPVPAHLIPQWVPKPFSIISPSARALPRNARSALRGSMGLHFISPWAPVTLGSTGARPTRS